MTSIHEDARCADDAAVDGASIGAFSTVGRRATAAPESSIGCHVTLGDGAAIGYRSSLDDGARVGAGIVIGDDVHIGANAVLESSTSGVTGEAGATIVDSHVVVGAGALVAASLKLGLNSIVRPGSVVTSAVPPNAIVEGNPARIVGYVDARRRSQRVINAAAALEENSSVRTVDLGVGESAIWRLPRFEDLRGALVPTDFASDLPFPPKRVFFVFDVPGERVRGEHAHKVCAQFLVAVHGALSVVVDDGVSSREVRLDEPSVGLLLPPEVWGIQYQFSKGAVLGVFASTAYDPDDYIRQYTEFRQYVANKTR